MTTTTDTIGGMERVEVRRALHVYDVPPRFATQHVSVLLHGLESSRWLPVWMTKEEAFGVRAAATGTASPFPTAEPPLWSVVEAAEGVVERVVVTEATVFQYATEIVLRLGAEETVIPSPPASALMLALRAGAPIFVSEEAFAGSGAALAVVTGRVRVAVDGRATLEPEASFGPDEATAMLAIDDDVVRDLGLVDGDQVKSRVGLSLDGGAPDGGYRVERPGVISVSGEEPVLLHDVAAVGTPLRLAVPNGWVQVTAGGYVPRRSTSMEVALWGGSLGRTELRASEVPARMVEELGGAVERLDDSGFELGDGFEVSLRMRALREVAVPPDAGGLMAGATIPAGGTAQLMIAVRAGHPVMASLSTLDWDEWGALTSVLSRSTLVGGEPDPGDLSEREIEVLRHIADGETNLQIAGRLGISEHTVANHVRSILMKLEAANRTQAASYGFARGILEGVAAAPR